MPPPPPPPPAPGPPKRPPQPSGAKKAGVGDGGALNRGALLASIEKGAKLKKTVTNDRSAPIVGGKVNSSSSSSALTPPTSNGPIHGTSSGVVMVNGGAPQLGGLFAGGMPKLRPTGRVMTDATDSGQRSHYSGGGVGSPMTPVGKKPSAPPTPPGNVKPSLSSSHSSLNSAGDSYSHNSGSSSNGYLPPSPKPSSKSNPAPPPPPSYRKPSVPDKGPGARPHLEVPPPTSKPSYSKQHSQDSHSSPNEERQPNPPLPAKPPSFKARPEPPGPRGAPPRPPPSSSKPTPPPKSPDMKPGIEPRRPSIDRSVSLREPYRPPPRVGTSAESPAAPFRVNTNHREAPPVPACRPQLSKTVGRAAGARLMPSLRPPTDRPPKPPQRPVVAAPPPPSQPPPPPPSHRGTSTPTNVNPGPKADVPLPPIPHSAGGGPPPPPERNESTRTSSNIKQVGDFEAKFSNCFKSRHQFPLPLTYNNVQKIYPSKNNGKSQRRAPLPPTAAQQQQQKQEQHQHPNRGPAPLPSSFGTSPRVNPKTGQHSSGVTYPPSYPSYNNNPPPPPPHAPLHLQMDRKFYSTEASHC